MKTLTLLATTCALTLGTSLALEANTSQPRTSQAEAKVAEKAAESEMGKRLADKLVTSQNGTVKPLAADKAKDAKYYFFYHSAEWCPPCRAFTPRLVQYYNERIKDNPNVEVVFLSADNSASAMGTYMTNYKMPWPAVAYDQREDFMDVIMSCGQGIPGMAIYDRDGNLVASGDRMQVLQKLESLL